MMNDFEQWDLTTLLSIYTEEAKAFSMAISRGDSWQELRDKRLRIRLLNEAISKKYQENLHHHQERRRDSQPPHSSK